MRYFIHVVAAILPVLVGTTLFVRSGNAAPAVQKTTTEFETTDTPSFYPAPVVPPVEYRALGTGDSAASSRATERAHEEAKAALEAQENVRKSQQILCSHLDKLEDNVVCRLSLTPEQLKRQPHDPKECDRGTDEWAAACKKRSATMYACYDLPVGQQRIDCLKSDLRLPHYLEPVDSFCADEHTSCPRIYRQAVHHLIVARFNDAETRVYNWFQTGKLSKSAAKDFIVFITKAKLSFYNAETKVQRKEVIQTVDRAWNTLRAELQ